MGERSGERSGSRRSFRRLARRQVAALSLAGLVLLLATAAALAVTGDLTQPAGTAGCVSETGAGPCADGHGLDAARGGGQRRREERLRRLGLKRRRGGLRPGSLGELTPSSPDSCRGWMGPFSAMTPALVLTLIPGEAQALDGAT